MAASLLYFYIFFQHSSLLFTCSSDSVLIVALPTAPYLQFRPLPLLALDQFV